MNTNAVILLLIIIGAAVLLGAFAAKPFDINLSSGPAAEAEYELALAQADSQRLSSQAQAGADAQQLEEQARLNEESRATRVFWLKAWDILRSVFVWGGGLILLVGLALGMLNLTNRMRLHNISFQRAAIHSSSGKHHAIAFPELSGVYFIAHDDAPLTGLVIGLGPRPMLIEPAESARLAFAHALTVAAEQGYVDTTTSEGAALLQTLLNVTPRPTQFPDSTTNDYDRLE